MRGVLGRGHSPTIAVNAARPVRDMSQKRLSPDKSNRVLLGTMGLRLPWSSAAFSLSAMYTMNKQTYTFEL